jgi:hypothetical protein
VIDEESCEVFQITSETLLRAKKNNFPQDIYCSVDNFARSSKQHIIDWIIEMEQYFIDSKLTPDMYVGFMFTKIECKFIKEIISYRNLAYLDFRDKLI